jgi:hypothetical protein
MIIQGSLSNKQKESMVVNRTVLHVEPSSEILRPYSLRITELGAIFCDTLLLASIYQ